MFPGPRSSGLLQGMGFPGNALLTGKAVPITNVRNYTAAPGFGQTNSMLRGWGLWNSGKG
jgi:hypothetical protein